MGKIWTGRKDEEYLSGKIFGGISKKRSLSQKCVGYGIGEKSA